MLASMLLASCDFNSGDKSFVVTYNPNGGEFASEVKDKEAVLDGEKPINVPTEEQIKRDSDEQFTYKFKGWSYSYEDESELVNPKNEVIHKNTTFYVQYDKIPIASTYVVTYEGNGGKIDGQETTTEKVNKGNKPVNVPNRELIKKDDDLEYTYVFIGWSTSAEGGQVVDPSQTTINEDVTFYAQYTQYPISTTFTVTYDANGGKINGEDRVTEKVVAGKKPTNVPKKETITHEATEQYTYTFKNWTKTEGGLYIVDPSTITITSNITFYAQYEQYEPRPTVSFYENDQTTLMTKTSVDNGVTWKKVTKPNAPEIKDFQFLYWSSFTHKIMTDDVKITESIKVFPRYYKDFVVYDPVDDDIVTYGSTAIDYEPSDTKVSNLEVTATSSNPDLLTCWVDKEHTCVQVQTKYGNVSGSADITITDSIKTYTKTIKVHPPTSMNELAESIDFAIARNKTITVSGQPCFNFSITPNFDIPDEYENKPIYKFIQDYMETSGLITGLLNTNLKEKEANPLLLYTESGIGQTKVDIKSDHPESYYENIKNANYEMRHANMVKRTEDHFFIDDVPQSLTVYNSDSLFFALEHGFRPVFPEGIDTPELDSAKAIYSKAREYCLDAFGTETTNNYEKMRALTEYLVDKTHYDYWIIDQSDDFHLYSSYYAEGVFLNSGIAVCDGFSKSLAIMAGIEGLNCVRGFGFAHDDQGETTSGHAWNYFKYDLDGKWYLICPTWIKTKTPGNVELDAKTSYFDYDAFMTMDGYFYDRSYKLMYASAIAKGHSEEEAQKMALEYAKENDFNDHLIDKSQCATKQLSNLFDLDKFDSAHSCNLKSNSDAEALATKIYNSGISSDFTLSLSSTSSTYWSAFKTKMQSLFGSRLISIVGGTITAESHITVFCSLI